MVIQDRMIRERNLGVDFWKDDWKNAKYAQQIMHCHDEAQFEISKDLVKWKKFPTEKEAKVFSAENPDWIGPLEAKGAFFLANSPLNTVFRESVDVVNDTLKMNIPMAIDPQYGLHWAQCH